MPARPSSGVVSGAEYKLSGFLTQVKNYVLGGELTVPDTTGYPPPEHYHGDGGEGDPYVVESDPEKDIYLPTRNKLMEDDLLIKKIRRHDVVNASGGKTVYIANKEDPNEA